jgi:2-polyprenyl-6-hydroxyphenyl methylase / 3-demethylubiquinone-9 3-methyltransferase
MPVDNHLYDTLADSWWDESGVLSTLQGLNPARLGYMRRVLTEKLRIDLHGKPTLDVGCGGGLLAEEFARLGCTVTGIDPSEKSLEAARAHALEAGLAIEYHQGVGERLPCPDSAFEIVYCCDTLEHVDNLDKVIAEISRVLKAGGVFLYDTLNRTFRSWLFMIKIFQDWDSTRLLPPDLHDWHRFIKPGELLAKLAENGFENRDLTGLTPSANPVRAIHILRARKRGEISYLEAMRRLDLRESGDLGVLYAGYALKLS